MKLRNPRKEPFFRYKTQRQTKFLICVWNEQGGTLKELVCVCGVMGLSGATQRKSRRDPYGAFRLREKEGSKVE